MKDAAPVLHEPKQTSLLSSSTKHICQNAYRPLWLCIYFPKLAAHSLRVDTTQAAVIYEADTQKRTIHYASTYAQQFGIEAGMDLNKAHILCEHINTYARNQQQEKDLIKKLAHWATRFSSHISVKYDSSILIEIKGSIKLFKGIEQLKRNIAQQLCKKEYTHSIAIAPTPAASYILAKASRNITIHDKNKLRTELGKLNLCDFLIDHSSLEKLHKIGLQRGQQLLRLPPADLARRLGNGFCRYLNELLGVTHENITPIQPRHSFYRHYEFQKDQDDLKIILLHAELLLKKLMNFLVQRDLSTRKLRFVMHTSNKKQIAITIESNTQCRNESIWKNIIKEKFYSTPFSSSIYQIALHVEQFEAYAPKNATVLCNGPQTNQSDWEIAIDQLTARLGKDRITTMDATEDHRPEFSHTKKTYTHKPSFKKSFLAHPYRPIWLLEKPIRITPSTHNLKKSQNIERIEDGWWDQNPIRRDYFIAKNKSHNLLWIFTDLKQNNQQFIHGYFA